MKTKQIIIILISILLHTGTFAQNINGVWKTDEGVKVQIQRYNNGFVYKNMSTGLIYNSVYVGTNYGVRTFRTSFRDGSFILYMIQSENVINVSYSFAPLATYTWKKISAPSSSNNRNQNSGFDFSSGTERTETVCSVCNGTGYSQSVVYAPSYGGTVEDEWCSICKEYRRPHTHKVCFSCGGIGYR